MAPSWLARRLICGADTSAEKRARAAKDARDREAAAEEAARRAALAADGFRALRVAWTALSFADVVHGRVQRRREAAAAREQLRELEERRAAEVAAAQEAQERSLERSSASTSAAFAASAALPSAADARQLLVEREERMAQRMRQHLQADFKRLEEDQARADAAMRTQKAAMQEALRRAREEEERRRRAAETSAAEEAARADTARLKAEAERCYLAARSVLEARLAPLLAKAESLAENERKLQAESAAARTFVAGSAGGPGALATAGACAGAGAPTALGEEAAEEEDEQLHAASLQRASAARSRCEGFLLDAQRLVQSVADSCAEAERYLSGARLSRAESKALMAQELVCVDLLKPLVGGYLDLCALSASWDYAEKLLATLGAQHAARLGVAAHAEELKLHVACEALQEALGDLEGSKTWSMWPRRRRSRWSRVRNAVRVGRVFGVPMLQILQTSASRRLRGEAARRRHALMLVKTLANDIRELPEAQQEKCRRRLRPLLKRGLAAAQRSGGDLQAIRDFLACSRQFGLDGDLAAEVGLPRWLGARVASALASTQPVAWAAELLVAIRNLPGIEVAGTDVSSSLLRPAVQRCARGVCDGSLPPAQVNVVAVFRTTIGASKFDEAFYAALCSLHDEGKGTQEAIGEWLVAYCEHTGAQLPAYCLTKEQKRALLALRTALAAGAKATALRSAVISARLVKGFAESPDLVSEYERGIETLRRELALPAGWDVEDLLASEKLFRKELLTDVGQVMFFQRLMTETLLRRWTRDRALRGDGEAIASAFDVTSVVEVRNGRSWESYSKRRREIEQECRPPHAPLTKEQWEEWSGPVMTEASTEGLLKACNLPPLELACNEFLLFHGTNPSVADIIAERHFDISFASKNGMFGAGLYFAEASSKSDEYAAANDDGEYPVLIVRVTLGRIRYVDSRTPAVDPGRADLENSCLRGKYHSILGDRAKAVGTYRELIVYDHFQAYPHFILWYKRRS